MKKSCFVVGIALASLLVLGFTGISFGQEFFVKDGVKTIEGPKWVPGEILVKFKPGVSGKVIADMNSRHGASVISTSRFAGFKRLRIPGRKTVADMVEIYKRNPNVEYVEPNMVPNDPYYEYQWHMGQINMEDAWDITSGNHSVIVAVIDTGVAYENYEEPGVPIGKSGKFTAGTVFEQAPDLANTNFVPGFDFVNEDSHPNDDEGHGTHVTGTIAQSTNNHEGVAGVAFNTSIMPIKVLDSSGSGTYADIADGIYFAGNAELKANIINMSLGGSSGSTTLEDALRYAYNEGVTIICSSGNNGSTTTVSYPAAYDAYCIAVGATRYDEAVAYYSNGGASLDLTAPGGDTNVDQNGDGHVDGVLQQTFDGNPTNWGYWLYQGTSMAAPHVSGVAALLIANSVASTPGEVREALQSTAYDIGGDGWDPAYGWGIVDAYAALNYSSALNNTPEADVGGPYLGDEDSNIFFDGSGSYDLDDDSLTYKWTFGDGSSGSGVSPTHTYTAGGEYTVTLVVNDGKIDSLPSTISATIDEVNDPPVADAGPDQTAAVDMAVSFDGSNSYDPDGAITYEWNFGDDKTGVGVNPTHEYLSAGKYTVTLTVTDDGSPVLTDADTAIVTVTEEPSLVMHVADIAMSTKKAGLNVNAIATVTVVDVGGAPVGTATVSGHWSELTNDSDSMVTDENGTVSLNSNKVKNAIGEFIFTVDDITKDGWTYDSATNVETSNGIAVP
ncbi:MAG: S8 family serine peptidase [Deltaproteobacteria bacterium]|nr:S8 family serine peptidase [Deltaproteobacteria bacterium]